MATMHFNSFDELYEATRAIASGKGEAREPQEFTEENFINKPEEPEEVPPEEEKPKRRRAKKANG